MQRAKEAVGHFWREKLVRPAQQLTCREVLVAVVAGLIGGIFPVPLITTVVTILFARSLHLLFPQLAVATTVNMFCTPLQILCIPPLAQMTATLLRENTAPFTATALKVALQQGFVVLLQTCARMLLYATFSWTLLVLPVWFACRRLQQSTRHRRDLDSTALPGREYAIVSQTSLP